MTASMLRACLGTFAVVAALLGAAGCFVPPIEDVDDKAKLACDGDHPCVDGFECIDGSCEPLEGTRCSPGETAVCGLQRGACTHGHRSCGADGKFGPCEGGIQPVAEFCNDIDDDCDGDTDEGLFAGPCESTKGVCATAQRACIAGAFEAVCTAASYGPDYQPGAETSCDGKDNDCDGITDEGLTQACPNQQGVCKDSAVACTAGAFPACDAAAYLAHDARFELQESKCDGADNDCDGLVDRGAPLNVSGTGTAHARADAVMMQPSGMLVLYEDGSKILARALNTQGELSPAVAPAKTVEVATAAKSPVLATDGTSMFAAWIEEYLPGSFRVMVAELGPDGRSKAVDTGGNALASPVPGLSCAAAASPCASATDCCSNVCTANLCTGASVRTFEQVALTAGSGRLFVSLVESGTGAQAHGAVLPQVLPPQGGVVGFSYFNGAATRVSTASWGPGAMTAIETGSGVKVFSVDVAAQVSNVANLMLPGLSFPQVVADPQGSADVYALELSGGAFLRRIPCDGTGCMANETFPVPEGTVSALRVTGTASQPLIAWSVAETSGTPQGFVTNTLAGTPSVLSLGGAAGSADAPIVRDANGTGAAVFVSSGDVWEQWVCLP